MQHCSQLCEWLVSQSELVSVSFTKDTKSRLLRDSELHLCTESKPLHISVLYKDSICVWTSVRTSSVLSGCVPHVLLRVSPQPEAASATELQFQCVLYLSPLLDLAGSPQIHETAQNRAKVGWVTNQTLSST